jgi:hypothetical protein
MRGNPTGSDSRGLSFAARLLPSVRALVDFLTEEYARMVEE